MNENKSENSTQKAFATAIAKYQVYLVGLNRPLIYMDTNYD